VILSKKFIILQLCPKLTIQKMRRLCYIQQDFELVIMACNGLFIGFNPENWIPLSYLLWHLIMVALFTDLLVVLTFECLILFKIMHFDYVWVLSEHPQHPVYASKPMNLHCISDVKKLSLQYCLKLSSNQSNPADNSVFNSKFISVFERKPTQLPPLAVRVSCDMKQIGFKKSDVVLSVIPSTPPWLLTRPEPPLLGQKQYSRNF